MAVIAVATTKGGSGKTTLASCLLDYWRRSGLRVTGIDTDPNRNLQAWAAASEGAVVAIHVPEDEVVDAVVAAEAEADVVIVDVAGFLSKALVYAVGVADIVLIPAKSDMKDLLEAARTIQQIDAIEKQARRRDPAATIRRAVVMCQVQPRTQVATHAREQATALGLPLLEAAMSHRTAYQAVSFRGMPCDDAGVHADVTAVADEVGRMLGWE